MATIGENFNSTMVRLKERPHLAGIRLPLFQFHYGTIKRILPDNRHSRLPNFNSTMVRLKAERNIRDAVISEFQFHYGTIKSCPGW